MNKVRIVVPLALALFATAAFASDAQASFEKLKALQGNWVGKAMNQDISVSFRLTSGDSAILSEIHSPENMISMIHLDGDRLMLTHYCGAGNQPRMVATVSPDGKTFTFNFVDGTNILSSQPGHMGRMVLTLMDADHHTEEWEFIAKDGAMQHHELFDLHRSK